MLKGRRYGYKKRKPRGSIQRISYKSKTLKEELGDEPYIGEQNFEFLGVGLISLYSLFYVYESLKNLAYTLSTSKLHGEKNVCKEKKVFELILALRTKFEH